MVIIQPRVFTVFFSLQAVALAARRLLRSSEMLSLTPLSRGREMYALLPLPMMKTLFNLKKKGKKVLLTHAYKIQVINVNIVIFFGNAGRASILQLNSDRKRFCFWPVIDQ